MKDVRERIPPGCALRPSRAHLLLLRAALLPEGAAREAWWEWRGITDLDQLDYSSLQLLPRAFSNLGEALGDDGFDRWVRGIVRASWLKSQSLAAGARPLLADLLAHEVPVMLVKGMAVVEYFPRGFADRPMVDLDIAVPRAHRRLAWRRLEALGFKPQIDLPVDSPMLLERGSWNFTDANGADVDLHWRALPIVAHEAGEEQIWSAVRPVEFVGLSCHVPAPRHVLFQSVLHASAWEPSPPVRWAADATLLLRGAGDRLDWRALVADATALRIRAPLRAALTWIAEEFAAPVPAAVLDELHRVPRWQVRELHGLLVNPADRSSAERRAIAFGQQLRRDLPPGAEPGPLSQLGLAASRRQLRGIWAVPLWGAFVLLGRPALLRPDAERLRLRRADAPTVPIGERLGFGHGGAIEPFLSSGWEWGAEHGRWTRGADARLELTLPQVAGGRVRIEVGLIPFLTEDSPVRHVDVWANGLRVARWLFRGREMAKVAAKWEIELPRRVTGGDGRLSILFHVRDPYVSTHQHGHAREPRALGIHVGWIEVQPSSRMGETGEVWRRI